MIKHCVGNSQINSIPVWSKEFSYITFLYRTLAKVNALARADITSIHSQGWSIKVHRRALVPYSLPSLWKIRKRIQQFSIFDPATWQHPLEKPRHVRGYMTSICSENRKIVPYHGSARIPRLTVSVPDYGSCFIINWTKKWKSCFCFFTDRKHHKARELDMITRDLECQPWHDYCIICSYVVTGTDFENSLYAFGQSEKS